MQKLMERIRARLADPRIVEAVPIRLRFHFGLRLKKSWDEGETYITRTLARLERERRTRVREIRPGVIVTGDLKVRWADEDELEDAA